MQVKVDVQLRCDVCDTVLSTSMLALEDKDGFYAYVDPCPRCAAQPQLETESGGVQVGAQENDENDRPKANWKCPKCYLINAGDWPKCERCGAPSP